MIAWVGTAIFAALALGGPMGAVLYETQGFGSIAIATALLPLAIIPFILGHADERPHQNRNAALSVQYCKSRLAARTGSCS